VSVYQTKNSKFWQYDFQWKGVRFHGSTGCRTKREALAYEEREKAKARAGVKERPQITVDEACGLYEAKVKEKPSWATMRYILAALVKGLGANRVLSDVGQRDLLHFFSKRRNGRSNASVNREVENCRAVWRWAARARFDVGEMPDWGALMLKVPAVAPRELAATEEAPLFDHLRADVRDCVHFALLTGWRKSEVFGLRWSDCDLGAAIAKTKIKGGDIVTRPLTSDMIVLIANQPKVGPFVFTYVCQKSREKRRKGQRYPMTATAMRVPWAAAKKAAQVEGFRFHDLRHTRGTRILRATGNLAAAKEALKHKNIKTTLRYAHAADEDVRNALEVSESRNSPGADKSKKRKG
jgi:integrase